MEERLLGRRLPEPLREQLSRRFGTWVQCGKLWSWALPPTSTTEQDLRGGDAAVVSDPRPDDPRPDDPAALDPSGVTPRREHPDGHSCGEESTLEDSVCGPTAGDLLPPAAQPENREANSAPTTVGLS